jgi:2-polyprenyl-3-methyl-5-hydroxy-6-metoxy-1,4-benzoquinol methylase
MTDGPDGGPLVFDPCRRVCLVCGSDRLARFTAVAADSDDDRTVSIVECRSCSFAWQHPLDRTAAESAAFFQMAYQDGGQCLGAYFEPEQKRDIALLEFEFVASLPGANRRLLDVGAGAGQFAGVAAEQGWTVTAVDPALSAEPPPRLDGRLRLIRGTLDDVPADESFDVVTLWDVIEHIPDPVDQILKARRHLRPNGWLVIETGNYKSADRIRRGRSHWIYQLDHRWYFSPDSIERLVTRAGFSNLIFAERVLRPGWNGTPAYAGPSRRSLLSALIRKPLEAPSHLERHRTLRRARSWNRAGLGIFAVAARLA